MSFDTRYAIYLLPHLDSGLMRFGNAWLGRDPDADEAVAQPVLDEVTGERMHEITASPRHYGFHGTLKAPFSLATGREASLLQDTLEAFAASRRPFDLKLKVDTLGGFLALVPAEPSPALDELAAACVHEFEDFRAPLSAEDRARRRPEHLSDQERQYLETYGYPYVLDAFRFHMTFTQRLEEPEQGQLKAILAQALAPVLAKPFRVNELALFTQTHEVAPFRVARRFHFHNR